MAAIENRGRFMRELIDEIKSATPDHPLVVRLNGTELMDQWGGNTEDECLELMKQAADAGVDMISVTIGWQEAPQSSIGRDIPPGHWNPLAARAKSFSPIYRSRSASGCRMRTWPTAVSRRASSTYGRFAGRCSPTRKVLKIAEGRRRRGPPLRRLSQLLIAALP